MKKKIKFLLFAALAVIFLSAFFAFAVFGSPAQSSAYSLEVMCANSGNITVTVNGAVVHNGGGACNITVPKGNIVTLSAEKKQGDFLFWADENMNTQGSEKSISFVMVCPTYLQAWFEEYEGTRVVYRNSNTTEQILASATYISSEHFTEHLVSDATRFGYDFLGWSLTVDEIKAGIDRGDAEIQVSPQYSKSAEEKSINVIGGKIKGKDSSGGNFTLGNRLTLVADAPESSESFLGWRDSMGNFVSFDSEFSVAVMTDETYTAIFTSNSNENAENADLGISIVKENGGFRLFSKHCISEEYELLVYGFIYANRYGCNAEVMTLDTAEYNGMTVAEYTVGENTGALTCVSYADSISARAFAVYTDGVRFYTLYSDTVSEKTDS